MRIFAAMLLSVVLAPLQAADLKVAGDQMIISGRAAGNELTLVRDAIAEHGPRITTVILRDFSGRTNNNDLKRIAELFTERGWRTAASGFCGTACAYLFMGGVQRHFTDDKSPGQTEVMFGSTNRVEDSRTGTAMRFQGDAHTLGNHEYRAWIKERAGGKVSDAVLDRLFVSDDSIRYLHFFDSNRLKRTDGVSMLVCDGKEAPADRWKVCEKVAGTDAYREGVVTSPELLRSNDLPARTPAGSSPKQ